VLLINQGERKGLNPNQEVGEKEEQRLIKYESHADSSGIY
jgi:hypothetical protein